MLEAKEVLNQVTTKDVIDILEKNGSKLYKTGIDGKTSQNILWFRTICHGGDSHKLCYFTQSKDFFCYTNCGRMTFYDFIKKIRNLKENEFYEAVKYVAKEINYRGVDDREGISLTSIEDKKSIREDIFQMEKAIENKKLKYINKNMAPKVYDGAILHYFQKVFYEGWIKDGISISTMEKYNILWYEFQKHIIIPHLDINGHLIGIRRRSLKLEDAKRKYMPECIEGIIYEHSLGTNLYGLYYNKEAIKKYKRAIIVEGEKSVLLSDTYYGEKSLTVATCGFNISDQQIQMLLQLGVEDITIAFDKDFDVTQKAQYYQDEIKKREFERYIEKLNQMGNRIANYCNLYIIIDKWRKLGEKDSPFDKGKRTFEFLLNNRMFYNELEFI